MKIVCFHVLNDYSGSPKVLEMVLSGLLSKGYSINLVTSKGNGALNNLQGKKNMIFTSTIIVFPKICCGMLYSFCMCNAIFFLFFSLSVSKRYCVLSEYHHAGGGCCCR